MRHAKTIAARAVRSTMRHAKTGRINLGSLKAECRKFAKTRDLQGLTDLRDSLPADDLYHRAFVQSYVDTINEGRAFNL